MYCRFAKSDGFSFRKWRFHNLVGKVSHYYSRSPHQHALHRLASPYPTGSSKPRLCGKGDVVMSGATTAISRATLDLCTAAALRSSSCSSSTLASLTAPSLPVHVSCHVSLCLDLISLSLSILLYLNLPFFLAV